MLQTKLYIPPTRSAIVPRSRLAEQLTNGLNGKLTLVCAPAGFGKTTLITDWLSRLERSIAWVSLDEDDSDPQQFFRYVAAAIRPFPDIQNSLAKLLPSSQPLPTKALAAALVNDLASVSTPCLLVLDDYHEIDNTDIDLALSFLLDHMPPSLHLVITSRSDPSFPLARLRARNHLNELRVHDLRFTQAETAQFLQQSMNLTVSPEQIAALEARTEGWIAGLQMAALSMRNRDDVTGFIENFTSSHRFVMDYLLEEVLNQQSAEVQDFLLETAVLTRLCADLCDAVRQSTASQQFLKHLETNNIFLIPLDNERRWYRYHHLFADLLRQRLYQGDGLPKGDVEKRVNELHHRASVWCEDNGLEIDAFHHAAAANDLERTERLIEGAGIPLHFRGAGLPVLHWLASLPTTLLDARPSLWVIYASTLLFVGQHTAVEQKLQAAEVALQDAGSNHKTKDLVGRIASIRATLAIIQNDVETIIAEALRAQENLHPDNLIYRISTNFALGTAYMFQGDKTAASQAFADTISIGENSIYAIAATINLGNIQETNNHLNLAAKTYESGLHLAGDPPPPITCEGFLGLARIHYEWNDLDAAEQYGQQSFQMTQQMENVDSFAAYGVFLSRLKLVQGDVSGATAALAEAEAYVRQHHFLFRLPDVVAAQVRTLLRRGNLTAAAHLAEEHDLPISQARVHLAQGDTHGALALLQPLCRQMEAKGWHDERLKIMIVQALVLQAQGETDAAVQLLGEALALAEPNGFIRIFVDEGLPMAQLLSETAVRGIMPSYCEKLLAVFASEGHPIEKETSPAPAQSLVDPLTKREMEILSLIASGLRNREIAAALFVSVNTVHYHTKNLYSKLGVNSRTQAITRANELNLLA